jgi:phthalate 4,5-dioxygenase oxygenase subunit
MGPQPPPSLPEFGTSATGRSVCVRRVLRKCNWVQALEGDIDSSHLAFAHRRPVPKGDDLHFGVPRKQVVVDTEVGCSCAAVFDARETVWFALISHFLFPFYVMVPFGDIGRSEVETRCWVPLDDEHTLFWDILFLTDAAQQFLDRTRCEYLPASSDPLSRFNPVPCSLNDYLIDREMQRTTSFMGMTNVILEDQALTESMGPICDRSQEHLGSADTMIIHTRRRLIESARELQKNGVPPPGVQQPDGYRRRAVKLVVSAGSDVFAAAERLIFAQDS